MPVKKRILLPLLLLMMTAPAAGGAQEETELFDAVTQSLTQGLTQGTVMAYAAMSEELTLELAAQESRIEPGKALRLTVTAGNPRPQETSVVFSLQLPERLKAAQETVWEAVLPAAQMNDETGRLEPSVTTFTRELALMPGGKSEQADIGIEMSMGTRFYRAGMPVALCVPDVRVSAETTGTQDGRLEPGDAFAYAVKAVNAGAAPDDVKMELTLPEHTEPDGPMPFGFSAEGGVIRGTIRAEAAKENGEKPFEALVRIPLRVSRDALEDDEDASMLLSGTLQANGKRVALPRVQVCGARISARLLSDTDSLEAGEMAALRLIVVNSGLAEADVRLQCALPKGLKLSGDRKQSATPAEAGAPIDPGDGDAAAVNAPAVFDMAEQDGTLVFDLHMDAASETADGVKAATCVIELPVIARQPQEDMKEQLVGAALAWTVDDGPTQLGEAVTMRVQRASWLGISPGDWNGIFWASVLLLVTIGLLCTAVRSDGKDEDFCCE